METLLKVKAEIRTNCTLAQFNTEQPVECWGAEILFRGATLAEVGPNDGVRYSTEAKAVKAVKEMYKQMEAV